MLYSQGVTLEEMGIAAQGRRRGRDRRAQDLAHVRGALLPVPRHADAAVARPGLRRTVRHDGAALGRDRRPLFRPHHRVPREAGIPPARAVRALQDRGHRHHRKPARSARRITTPSRRPAGRAASSPPTGPIRWSIRSSTASRQTSRRSATSPAATRSPGTAISRRTGCAAPISSSTARPRPTTGTSSAQTVDLPQADAERLFAKIISRRIHRGRCRAVPRADADRDGAHEPRRRAGDADPSGLAAQSQSGAATPSSAATWAPIFRPAPTMCAR